MVGVVVAMNLYVDTKVPVGMSSFQDLTKTGDGTPEKSANRKAQIERRRVADGPRFPIFGSRYVEDAEQTTQTRRAGRSSCDAHRLHGYSRLCDIASRAMG